MTTIRSLDLVTELAQKFTVRGWDGPHYTPPDAPLSHGDWEISMGKRDEPNSRGNPWMIVNVWARAKIGTRFWSGGICPAYPIRVPGH
jgi:hypothetical protein